MQRSTAAALDLVLESSWPTDPKPTESIQNPKRHWIPSSRPTDRKPTRPIQSSGRKGGKGYEEGLGGDARTGDARRLNGGAIHASCFCEFFHKGQPRCIVKKRGYLRHGQLKLYTTRSLEFYTSLPSTQEYFRVWGNENCLLEVEWPGN